MGLYHGCSRLLCRHGKRLAVSHAGLPVRRPDVPDPLFHLCICHQPIRHDGGILSGPLGRLWTGSVLGRITTEQFQMLSGSYMEEQNQIAAGIPQKEADIQRLRETVSGTDGFLDRAKRYTDITELTPELLRLFIEKIVVHEKEVKWSKHAPQTVEIYYNGIGFVDSQQQDVESLQPLKAEEPRQVS